MEHEDRIAQFTRMVEADPDNELGHFSLGKALVEAGRLAEALPALERVIQINPEFSKAYAVLASAQVRLDKRDAALQTLEAGIAVADRRGDRMPRDEMAQLMTELGESPPEPPGRPAAAEVPVDGADFHCARCGRPARRMEKRPFKGDLGEQVWNGVCEACWKEWIGVGTKVVNEMGLQLADPHAQQIYDEHMVEFLQIDR
ncbi:MAG TPA: Fe(2+)-trafficking protein [Phycisphaerae bacterium]|nr:Fe(2+)-trafficking protein [Phycisphaerae bacterium]